MTTPGDPPADPPVVEEFEVPAGEAGVRLDQFVTTQLDARGAGARTAWTRSQVQRLIRSGHVRVAGARTPADVRVQPDARAQGPARARMSSPVREGDRIRVEIPPAAPAAPQPEALPVDIVHDDPDIVVVNKPAGMVVHPGAGHAAGTLVNALLHHVDDLSGIGGELRPGIVHRLDRGTSGLMVVAKHDAAHAELARQFKAREVEKTYTALVWGVVRQGRRIDLPIGRDPFDRKRISARARRARVAVTRIAKAEALAAMTLAKVVIATGRTHQIRVHLSAIGHPIAGDQTYGGRKRHAPGGLGDVHRIVQRLDRPFLHAARLAFTHPCDGRRLAFDCNLPDDLQRIVEELRTLEAARAGRRVRATG